MAERPGRSTVYGFISASIRNYEPGAKFTRLLFHFYPRSSGPGEFQPLTDVLERHTIAVAFSVAACRDDGIAHFDVNLSTDGPAANADGAAVRQHLDTMVDGILEQRLHDEMGHLHAHRQFIHVPLHLQPVAQA